MTTSNGLDSDIEAAVGDFFTAAGDGAAGDNVRLWVYGKVVPVFATSTAQETESSNRYQVYMGNHPSRTLQDKPVEPVRPSYMVSYSLRVEHSM